MARVAPVQTTEIRSNSQASAQGKSGDPFAMLLDTVSAGRVGSAEPRRKPEATEQPKRPEAASKPERPQPRNEHKRTEKKEDCGVGAKDSAPKEENTVSADQPKQEEPAGTQADAVAAVAPESSPETPVVAGINLSLEIAVDAEAPVEAGEVAPSATPVEAAPDAAAGVEADFSPEIQNVSAAQPAGAAVEATPAAAPEVAASMQDDAALTAAAKAAVPTAPKAAAAPVAEEAEVAVEDGPTTQPVQKTEAEKPAEPVKAVSSNHAEIRAEVIAERGEQASQQKTANAAEGQQQAREHASAKPLEVAAPQSNVENSTPRQSMPAPSIPVMPEPVRALAGSINPVNLRAADEGPANAVQANAGAIGVEIASRAKDGAKRFDIRLDPPELGRVEVRLEVDSAGKASTKLIVERPETLDLLQRDARNLERALQSAGLQTDEGGMEFSLQQQDQNEFADANSDRGYDRRGDYFASAIDEAEPASPAIDRYARAVLARGGVDIRI